MAMTWLRREGGREAVLFFNGWGMDGRVAMHMAGDADVAEVHDYRDLRRMEAPDLRGYEAVSVVAWSMGVWAAGVLVERWGVAPRLAVAVNGTGRPVDDLYGIPPRVYALTERGMDERGREKFFRRMLASPEEAEWFAGRRPRRALEEQVEELRLIREQAAAATGNMRWDAALVSEGDAIFPPANQRRWWEGRCRVAALPGGHYPFRELDNWNTILRYADRQG